MKIRGSNCSVPRAGRLVAACFACVLVVAVSFAIDGTSSAQILRQGYPPPPPTPTPTFIPTPTPTSKPTRSPKPTKTPGHKRACAQTGTIVRGHFKAKSTFNPGESIAVRGAHGCAAARARVTTVMDPSGNTVRLGSSNAGSNGAYMNTGRIPKNTTIGTHVIQSRTGKKRYSSSITVKAKGTGSPAAFLGSPAGLVAMGIVLAVLAIAFILAPRRRRRSPAALAMGSDVPAIDTSGFVPFIRRSEPKAPSKSAPRRRTAKKPQEDV
jgi:hypothetical protein